MPAERAVGGRLYLPRIGREWFNLFETGRRDWEGLISTGISLLVSAVDGVVGYDGTGNGRAPVFKLTTGAKERILARDWRIRSGPFVGGSPHYSRLGSCPPPFIGRFRTVTLRLGTLD
jgi:hypothetical protein